MTDINLLLQQAGAGDRAAADSLFTLLYADLRQLARYRMRQSGPLTLLSTTALVHESFLRLRLRGAAGLQFPDHKHFLAYAARAMRSVVVDLVRHRQAELHGGGAAHVTLGTGANEAAVRLQDQRNIHHDAQVLRVHEALAALAEVEPRLATVVELRYFGGLSEEEIASSLDLTVRTVQRDWAKARLYLAAALQ